jgi:intracellular multiplication protein IcmD
MPYRLLYGIHLGCHFKSDFKCKGEYVMKLSRVIKFVVMMGISGLFFYGASAFAQSQDIGSIAQNITKTFGSLAQLVTAIAYVAGMGFGMAAILKFKAHKDNPTQIPIGTPIALLFVAAALLFLPTLFGVAGQTIFGSSRSAGSVTGISNVS